MYGTSRSVLLLIYLKGMQPAPRKKDDKIALVGVFADSMEDCVTIAMRWNVRRLAAFGHDMFAAGTTLQCMHTTPANPDTLVRWCVRLNSSTKHNESPIPRTTFEEAHRAVVLLNGSRQCFPWTLVERCSEAAAIKKAYSTPDENPEWVVPHAFADESGYEWYLVKPRSGTDALGSSPGADSWLPNRTLHFCPRYMSIGAVDESTEAVSDRRSTSSLDKLLQYVGRTFVDLKSVQVPGGPVGMRWQVHNQGHELRYLENGVPIDDVGTKIRFILALADAYANTYGIKQADRRMSAAEAVLVCFAMGWDLPACVPNPTETTSTAAATSDESAESVPSVSDESNKVVEVNIGTALDGHEGADELRTTLGHLAQYAAFMNGLKTMQSSTPMILTLLPDTVTTLLSKVELTVDSYFVHGGCAFVNAAVEHQISLLSTRDAITNVRVYDAWEKRLAALGRGANVRFLRPSQRSTVPMLLRQAIAAGRSLMRDDSKKWKAFLNARVGTCGATIKSILGFTPNELSMRKELMDASEEVEDNPFVDGASGAG